MSDTHGRFKVRCYSMSDFNEPFLNDEFETEEEAERFIKDADLNVMMDEVDDDLTVITCFPEYYTFVANIEKTGYGESVSFRSWSDLREFAAKMKLKLADGTDIAHEPELHSLWGEIDESCILRDQPDIGIIEFAFR